jgi:hypothetical protein
VIASNLECEILTNVDGNDRRLRSSRKGACDRGWDLPAKGKRFPRSYSDGAVNVRANYMVTDACFIADRYEYIDFEATFQHLQWQGDQSHSGDRALCFVGLTACSGPLARMRSPRLLNAHVIRV